MNPLDWSIEKLMWWCIGIVAVIAIYAALR